MLSFPNGLIQASLASCRCNHVPKADTTIGETGKASLVAHRMEALADCATKQPPKLICRVRIVARGSKRSVTWQAAEQEQLDVRTNDGRQTGFDAQE